MVKVYVSKIEWCTLHAGYVVVLKEIAGERFCNIAVQAWEAQTIGVLLNQSSQESYKTAWLLSYILENSDIKILRVEIHKTFLGEILAKVLYCNRMKTYCITHTPGEAIELAMRCRASIMIPESMMSASESANQPRERPKNLIKQLKEKMEKAIEVEEYEKAAKLRDKILKIEKGNECK
jgi:bifunctional DNase/RNase